MIINGQDLPAQFIRALSDLFGLQDLIALEVNYAQKKGRDGQNHLAHLGLSLMPYIHMFTQIPN